MANDPWYGFLAVLHALWKKTVEHVSSVFVKTEKQCFT